MSTNRDRRFTQIGIDRVVRLKWLEKTASLVLAENDAVAVKKILREDLHEYFQTDKSTVRGSVDKSITVLVRIWIRVPSELEALRSDGITLLRQLPKKDHVAVHWGMTMASYPFWASVAGQVGRLLRLQSSVAAAHIQRRVREQYGERETVSRRVRYVLRSFVDWGVLCESGAKGVYSAGLPLSVDNIRLVSWLVEASLHARSNGSARLKDVVDGPDLFPFQIKPIFGEKLSTTSQRIELLRHGIDDELVMLSHHETIT
jgi:hypothetical protein